MTHVPVGQEDPVHRPACSRRLLPGRVLPVPNHRHLRLDIRRGVDEIDVPLARGERHARHMSRVPGRPRVLAPRASTSELGDASVLRDPQHPVADPSISEGPAPGTFLGGEVVVCCVSLDAAAESTLLAQPGAPRAIASVASASRRVHRPHRRSTGTIVTVLGGRSNRTRGGPSHRRTARQVTPRGRRCGRAVPGFRARTQN